MLHLDRLRLGVPPPLSGPGPVFALGRRAGAGTCKNADWAAPSAAAGRRAQMRPYVFVLFRFNLPQTARDVYSDQTLEENCSLDGWNICEIMNRMEIDKAEWYRAKSRRTKRLGRAYHCS